MSCVWAARSGLRVKEDSCVWKSLRTLRMLWVSVYSKCLYVCAPSRVFACMFSSLPSGLLWLALHVCLWTRVCVCMTEWVSRGAGQRAAPLRGRVLFSRRLHLSSRCHTSCWYAHCQSHRARVAQRGDEGHGERVCVCVCARGGWVQNEAAVL